MDKDCDNIRFNVLRNALYHTARRLHLERMNKFLNFLVVILGASAMSDLGAKFDIDALWIGGAIALAGSVQLVFDFAGQARTHQQLQRDYYYLLAEIEEAEDTPENLANWQARMMRITADEPPVLRAIDAKAFNDALDATGIYPEDNRLIIPWWQRPLAAILPFEGHRYKMVCEVTL